MDKEKNQIYGVVLPVTLAARARITAAILGISRSKLMRTLLLNYLEYLDTHVDRDINSSMKEVPFDKNQTVNKDLTNETTTGLSLEKNQ